MQKCCLIECFESLLKKTSFTLVMVEKRGCKVILSRKMLRGEIAKYYFCQTLSIYVTVGMDNYNKRLILLSPFEVG